MSDLISKEEAIAELVKMVNDHRKDEPFHGELLHWTGVKAMLESLPSRETKERWYAVAKEMPKPEDWGVSVLVYTVDHEYHVWTAMPYRADNYCWEDEEGYCHDKWEAELWMPFPEPWKGEEDGR